MMAFPAKTPRLFQGRTVKKIRQRKKRVSKIVYFKFMSKSSSLSEC